MLSPRILAQLSEVSVRDARAAVDPHDTDNLVELAGAGRVIGPADWTHAEYLSKLSYCQWTAAVCEGWDPIGCPWLSDEDNEIIRVAFWDRVLG